MMEQHTNGAGPARPATAPPQARQEAPEAPRHTITIRGPLALLAARLENLPPGEYMIQLDTTHSRRPRWKIGAQPPGWEKAHRDEERNP